MENFGYPNKRLLHWACIITRSDFELAAISNRFDQQTIVAQAFTLLAVTLTAVVAWGAFWSSFLPLWQAIPLGLAVGVNIFLLDQAIGASDFELAGVLRTEKYTAGWWGKLTVRVVISLLLAQATAVGVTLWMFSGAIENHLQASRAATNSPLEEEYATRGKELKKRIVDPLEQELKSLNEERKTLQESIQIANTQRNEAAQRASHARVEASRESDGGLAGYVRGKGPLWNEAMRQQGEADRLSETATGEADKAETRIKELSSQAEEKRQEMTSANVVFKQEIQAIESQKLKDPRWASERNDPLSHFIGLQELKKDPKYGSATRQFSWLMNLVLVTFELIFLIVKLLFAPASVYTIRLIARTKREAGEVSALFARNMDEIRRNRPRGGLRVVGGSDADNPNRDQERGEP